MIQNDKFLENYIKIILEARKNIIYIDKDECLEDGLIKMNLIKE